MRRNLVWMAAGVVACGVSSATLVRAEGRAVSKEAAAVFRTASLTPAPGFQQAKGPDGGMIYVSPRVVFTSDEVVSSVPGNVRGELNVTITPEAAARVGRSQGDLVAVMTDGKVAAVARLAGADADKVVLADLSDYAHARVSGLLGAQRGYGPVIRAVPQQPNAKPGSVVTVDVYVMNAPQVRTFQAALDVVGGRTGTLTRLPGRIDKARGDYIFGTQQAVAAVDDSRGRFGATLFRGAVDATEPRYLGSFDFKVSEDASGTFIVKVRFDDDTFLLDESSNPVSYSPMHATIRVGGSGARDVR